MKRLFAVSVKVEAIVQSQYEKYVEERLEQQLIPISNISPKQSVPFHVSFTNQTPEQPMK